MYQFEPSSANLNRLSKNPGSAPVTEGISKALNGPRQANLVLIAYASSEGSGEPAHPRSLARTFDTRLYKH